MPRGKPRIYGALPTAREKQRAKTQLFHGLLVPIQRSRPSLTVADFASDKGPKTRLMPIEELLKPVEGATSATPSWQSRLHLGAMPHGRKLRLVVGLISIAVTGYAALADVRASTPAIVAQAAPLVEAPPPAPAVREEPKRELPKKRASKAATPRKASDQLAAGDLARAASSYEQLAASAPHDPVYAEAARILRRRVGSAAP
jgi:hypothetical protein